MKPNNQIKTRRVLRLILPMRVIRRVIKPPITSGNIMVEFRGPTDMLAEYFSENQHLYITASESQRPNPNVVQIVEVGAFATTAEQKLYFPEGTRVMRVAKEQIFESSSQAQREIEAFHELQLDSCRKGEVAIAHNDCIPKSKIKRTLESEMFLGLKFGVSAIIAHKGKLVVKSEKVVLLCDAADLVEQGDIQVDTSYEKTVADVLRALNRQDFVDAAKSVFRSGFTTVAKMPILIIRIGSAAALVVTFDAEFKIAKEEGLEPKLLFHRDRPAPTKPAGLGDMTLYQWIYSAVIGNNAKELICASDSRKLFSLVLKCTKAAIYGCYSCFAGGFGVLMNGKFSPPSHVAGSPDAESEYFSSGPGSVQNMLKTYAEAFEANHSPADLVLGTTRLLLPEFKPGGAALANGDREKCIVDVKVNLELSLSELVFWRLSSECINWPDRSSLAESEISERRFVKAEELVTKSDEAQMMPVVRIGDLELIDRFEVQDYLFINGLLQDYAEDRSRTKPLSIGVFGQPGTGKSFGVGELVKAMSAEGRLYAQDPLKFNLSQFRSLEDLMAAFQHVRDASLRGSVPLVFFDEFDGALHGDVFGWLKYFLAPMEDGEFSEGRALFHFGRCVFVFAGGINHTFSEFNERVRNPEFVLAKGPDFISRLRGVLNIRRINRPDSNELDDGVYLQRRALVLRGVLRQTLGKEGSVTSGVARAFIRVSQFKHGVRSLKAIVNMSRSRRGEPLSVGQLPPIDQLAMHVDAREFLGLASSDP